MIKILTSIPCLFFLICNLHASQGCYDNLEFEGGTEYITNYMLRGDIITEKEINRPIDAITFVPDKYKDKTVDDVEEDIECFLKGLKIFHEEKIIQNCDKVMHQILEAAIKKDHPEFAYFILMHMFAYYF